MKLFLFECKKVLFNHIFFLLVPLTIFLSAFLYWCQYADRNEALAASQILEVADGLNIMAPSKQEVYLQEKQIEYAIRYTLLSVSDQEIAELLLQGYETDYPELYHRALDELKALSEEDTHHLLIAYNTMLEQYEYQQSYPHFLQTIQENADRINRFSAFSGAGGYAVNSAQKMALVYGAVDSLLLSFGPANGISSITGFQAGDFLMLVLLLALTVCLFQSEEENGALRLFKSCRNGRTRLMLAKFQVLGLFTAGILVLYTVVMLAMGGRVFGFGDVSRSIQSIPDFRECTFLISVREYLILAFAVKYLVFLIIGVFFIGAFLFAKVSGTAGVLLAALPIGIEWSLYRIIPGNFILNHLKYINLFYWLDMPSLLGEYTTLNVAGRAWSARGFLAFAVLAALVLVVLEFIVFQKGKAVRIQTANRRWSLPDGKRKPISSSLMVREGHRLLVLRRMLWLVLLCLGASCYLVGNYPEPAYSADELAYRNYMKAMAGPVTESTRSSLGLKEYNAERYANKLQELDEEYAAGLISQSEWGEQSRANSELYATHRLGLTYLREDFDYAEALADRQIKPYLQDRFTTGAWFSNTDRELRSALLLSVTLSLSLAQFFGGESPEKRRVIAATVNGRRKLMGVRMGWTALLLLLLSLTVYVPYWVYLVKTFGLPLLFAPLQSIREYAVFPYPISVLTFLIIRYGLGLLGLFALSVCIHAVHLWVKNRMLGLAITLLIAVIPILIQWQGIEIRYFTITNIFLIFDSIQTTVGFWLSACHLFVLFFISGGALRYIFAVYTGRELSLRRVRGWRHGT